MTSLLYTQHASPLGELLLAGDEHGLQRLWTPGPEGPPEPEPDWQRADEPFTTIREQLDAYFAGELRQFTAPIALRGTRFQRAAWEALIAIPYGETRSYGQLATELGQPQAVRAVGRANGRNPIAIVVPCHRVVGADGSLTGYGGGIARKRWLLDHEQRVLLRGGDGDG